ncbi:MAG: hypothetical protein LUD82_02435, partial [Clostridiales bacterium]|nr:hypothetical protein [Clostridiales bacterium]
MKVLKCFTALFCALALALSLAACGGSTTDQSSEESSSSLQAEVEAVTEYSNTTVTGQITAIDGATVTLQLGELAESEGFGGGELPDDDGGEMPGGEGGGEMPGGDADGSGTTPEMPDGAGGGMTGGGSGDMGVMGSSFTAGEDILEVDLTDVTVTLSDGSEGSASDLAVDDILQITFDEDGEVSSVTVVALTGGAGGGVVSEAGSGFGGGSTEVDQGTATTTLDADGDYSGETYTSTGDDENALRVDGATVTLDGITVDKSAGATSDTETGDFYSMNAALLATNGAQVTITNATVTSSAQNGNGVFSYGEGTVVTISDSTITTTADNSGGIQTTGGGTTN